MEALAECVVWEDKVASDTIRQRELFLYSVAASLYNSTIMRGLIKMN